MKRLIKAILIMAIVGFTVLYAEDGHSHNEGIKSAAIQEIAKREVARLVMEKKIAESWKSKPVTKIGRTHQSYIDDWVVVFENLKMKKKSKRTLYIFISKKGNVMGANYTGK